MKTDLLWPNLRTSSFGLITPNCNFLTRFKRDALNPKFSEAILREVAPTERAVTCRPAILYVCVVPIGLFSYSQVWPTLIFIVMISLGVFSIDGLWYPSEELVFRWSLRLILIQCFATLNEQVNRIGLSREGDSGYK